MSGYRERPALYHQDYPPSFQFVASPMRRSSSVATLDVRQEFLKSLWGKNVRAKELESLKSSNLAATLSTKSNSEKYFNFEFGTCIQEDKNTKVASALTDVLAVCYKYTKLVIYYMFVVMIGIPMTFVWACISGTVIFYCIWIWGPIIKLIKICIYSCVPIINTPIQLICSPTMDTCARIFGRIRIQINNTGRPGSDKCISQIQNA